MKQVELKCARCDAVVTLGSGRFWEVRIDAVVDPWPPEFTDEDLQRDVRREWDEILEQMKLEIDMHNAIENDQFSLVYQPKVETKNDSIESMEALIRWDHPEKGLLKPGSFISVAEKSVCHRPITHRCRDSPDPCMDAEILRH